jgi:transcription initiation factor IIE alpha subunit
MGFYGKLLIMIRNIIIDKDNNVAIYYCPQCEEFTSYDEWDQPQRTCINCGTSEK